MDKKEYIDRSELIKVIGTDTAPFTTSMVFRHIRNAPAADVVEVVRCRECAHYKICDEWESGNRMLCEIYHHSYLDHDGDNHFCSWGQRKIETILPKSDAKVESLEADYDKHPSNPV